MCVCVCGGVLSVMNAAPHELPPLNSAGQVFTNERKASKMRQAE